MGDGRGGGRGLRRRARRGGRSAAPRGCSSPRLSPVEACRRRRRLPCRLQGGQVRRHRSVRRRRRAPPPRSPPSTSALGHSQAGLGSSQQPWRQVSASMAGSKRLAEEGVEAEIRGAKRARQQPRAPLGHG